MRRRLLALTGALLSFALSTTPAHAQWAVSVQLDGVRISIGEFDLEPASFTWQSPSTGANGVGTDSLAQHKAAPGEVLILTQEVSTRAEGDNLAVELAAAWPVTPLGLSATWHIEDEHGQVAPATGEAPLSTQLRLPGEGSASGLWKAVLTITLPGEHLAFAGGSDLDLGTLTLHLRQVRHGDGFTASTSPEGLWEDSFSVSLQVGTTASTRSWTVTTTLQPALTVPNGTVFPVTVDGVDATVTMGSPTTSIELPAAVTAPTVSPATPGSVSGIVWGTPTISVNAQTRAIVITWHPVKAGLINSLATSGPADAAKDANPGDGICSTGKTITLAGTSRYECTLLAAIQEANAGGIDLVSVDPDFEGGTIAIAGSTGHRMTTAATGSPNSTGAYYWIKRAGITVDLLNRVKFTTNDINGAGFLIDAPNVTVRNMTGSNVGEDLFVITANGDNALIDSIVFNTTSNWNNENIAVVLGGADGVTLSNNQITGVVDDSWANVFVAYSGSTTTPITNLTITGNTYAGGTGSSCGGSNTTGCSAPFFGVYTTSGSGSSTNTVLQNVTIAGNTVTSFNQGSSNGNRLFNLQGATLSGVTIAQNRFLNLRSVSNPLVDLAGSRIDGLSVTDNTFASTQVNTSYNNPVLFIHPNQAMTGTNLVSGNSFSATETNSNGYAIVVWGAATTTGSIADSTLHIVGNTFNGFGTASSTATVLVQHAGGVEIARNAFGTGSGRAATMTAEENGNSGSLQKALIDNYSRSANAMLQTWYPTAAVNEGDAIQLTVSAPTTATDGALLAASPVTLEVYWTTLATAERYVGSYEVTTGGSAVLTVPTADLPQGGYLRVLTHKGAATSQFSRTLAVPAAPAPAAQSMAVPSAAPTEADAPAEHDPEPTAPGAAADGSTELDSEDLLVVAGDDGHVVEDRHRGLDVPPKVDGREVLAGVRVEEVQHAG